MSIQASTNSPLAITMLLHFYCIRTPFISRPFAQWPNAQTSIVRQWLHRGVIEQGSQDNLFNLTETGEAHVKALLGAAKEVMP